ncbi:MAG TPA: hypothetical protein VN922_21765, partial [Bacteroidia bacterium]|nr:hypothetical protein [Bacteroidia bacterium]
MNNTVGLIKGIPMFVFNRDYVKRGVVTPQGIYHISKVYTKTYTLRNKHRLLGVVIGIQFNICYHIKLQNGKEAFGYFVSNNNNGSYQVQTIKGFDKFTYNHFENSYPLGEKIEIQETEIKE